MSANAHGALVLFGSGPGIGRSVAALFAERRFRKVILLSRNAQRLEQDAAFVRQSASGVGVSADEVNVAVVSVDLSDSAAVAETLSAVGKQLGDTPLEAVVYNAATLGASPILEYPMEKFETDLRITIVSLYAVAQWAFPRLVKAAEGKDSRPAFLVTSGLLHKDPAPKMFSLAAGKAGQFNLVHSLHKEFEPKGVHTALIVVGGTVKDEAKVTNPRNIAEEAWKLFSQKKGEAGKLEVTLLDPEYEQHVKNREQRK